jgi:hypothetical protein
MEGVGENVVLNEEGRSDRWHMYREREGEGIWNREGMMEGMKCHVCGSRVKEEDRTV